MTLREARVNVGLTLAEVASMCNVSAQAVQQWEHGKTTPTAQNLVKLAEIYCRDAGEILACTRAGKDQGSA